MAYYPLVVPRIYRRSPLPIIKKRSPSRILDRDLVKMKNSDIKMFL
ncbi:MAG: hypothetical protein ACKN9E_01855 [Microcystaceae cyanobacterium]